MRSAGNRTKRSPHCKQNRSGSGCRGLDIHQIPCAIAAAATACETASPTKQFLRNGAGQPPACARERAA